MGAAGVGSAVVVSVGVEDDDADEPSGFFEPAGAPFAQLAPVRAVTAERVDGWAAYAAQPPRRAVVLAASS
jgi:hypothetical protein